MTSCLILTTSAQEKQAITDSQKTACLPWMQHIPSLLGQAVSTKYCGVSKTFNEGWALQLHILRPYINSLQTGIMCFALS